MKVAVITGASSGLGLHTAKALYATKEFIVVLACRNYEKASRAISEILNGQDGNDERLHLVQLDLTSKPSIEAFATNFRAKFHRLDVLINNAGIMGHPYEITNGIEVHFVSNHLGHFLMINLLQEALTPNARIINVSSGFYKKCPTLPSFEELIGNSPPTACLSPNAYYAASKLANCLHTVALDERLKASGRPNVKVVAVRPGFIRGTDLGRHTNPLLRALASPLIWMIAKNIDEGIATIVYCATTAEDNLQSGMLYYDKKEEAYGPNVTEEAARQLWDLSERLVHHMK
ncbi:DHS-1 protein [Aphelenchoides avenae]|nr:DHS-1 protein [Aphelenchus avenae]